MELQTKISLKPTANKIDYNSKILLLGSCFAQNIGEKLDYFKFQTLQNPFGILFHPLAIERLIDNAVHKKQYSDEDVFSNNGLWHCFDTHSRLSDSSKENIIKKINKTVFDTHSYLKEVTHVIITLGTSWVYEHKASDNVVANCHKIRQTEFEKQLLSIEHITECLTRIIHLVHEVNLDAQIIFTVSPVRHLKDGFVENTLSKSHLISAIHQVLSFKASHTELVEVQGESLHYFPSYEIQLDELRDYRFYKEDMLHPNALAVTYIWERFVSVWMANSTHDIMKMVDTIQKGLAHQPLNPDSEAYKNFLKDLKSKINHLKEDYPFIDL
ncbi:MAG: GSCFA domain-containing protein [Psychroserpens sp.]|nr:GSCFA domain-containing protein [Psychroserpens sp.]